MQHIPSDHLLESAVLDHVCDQFSREATRYIDSIAAHRAVMRKHALRCDEIGGAKATPHLARLLQETTALLELCVDMARVQSAMIARQARSVRLVAGLVAGERHSDTVTGA